MRIFLLFAFIVTCASCQQIVDAPVPDLKWSAFDSPAARPLDEGERKAMEGIFTIGESKDDFGEEAVFKWSYVAEKNDTTYYLSVFCSEDVRYFICRGKKNDTAILLNGYWRNVENTKTGKAHFIIPLQSFSKQESAAGERRIIAEIKGVYGMFDSEPDKKINFQYHRPLNTEKPFIIVAHRGGGRNNDLLPASENSVEIIPLAAQLGANGIEIDVKLTKDSVPILYHDDRINDRLTNKTAIQGPLEEYSFSELENEVKLKRGGKIPTLREALETVLYKTPLQFVWLDCKYEGSLNRVIALQKEFTEKAAALGKPLQIFIGIPDENAFNSFLQLPDHKTIPSLCELDTTKALQMNASIWAPSWTKGHQDIEVASMHAKDKKAVVWTVDIPDKIKECMYEAKFDGLCTNRPTMAAYYYYARQ